jgi:hypothetical protein
MAADPALALEAVAAALHALFGVLSRSPGAVASLPEMELLQVRDEFRCTMQHSNEFEPGAKSPVGFHWEN